MFRYARADWSRNSVLACAPFLSISYVVACRLKVSFDNFLLSFIYIIPLSNSYLSLSLLYHIFANKSRRKHCIFNEIVLRTMKSKQVWMKSSLGSDEIKSVFISLRSKISSRSDFILRMRIYPVARRI